MPYIGGDPNRSALPVQNADIIDDAIDSEHYAGGSIDTAHIADDQITLAKLASGTDGNIISYDASGNPVAIATGDDGEVLTSAGAGAPPAFEAAGGGGGKILQVQYMTYGTGTTNNTSTFAASGLTDAITCAATSSKVLVMGTMHGLYRTGGGAAYVNYIGLRITKGGSAIASFTDMWGYSTGSPFLASTSWHYVDSPSSTSELTYAVEFKSTENNSTIKVNQESTEACVSMLVLMEIGA